MRHVKSGGFAMRQPHPLLKVAALSSAILLVGGFVAYRANAFHWRSQADETFISGTKSAARLWGSPPEPPSDSDSSTISGSSSDGAFESASTIMYSSKDGLVFTPPATAQSGSPGTIMSGSKSD